MKKSIVSRIALFLLVGTIVFVSACQPKFKGPKKNHAHHGHKGLAPSMGN